LKREKMSVNEGEDTQRERMKKNKQTEPEKMMIKELAVVIH